MIEVQQVTAKVKQNPNNKVTVTTSSNLGISKINNDNSVGARIIGIPGKAGKDGLDGDGSGSSLTWLGAYNGSTTYKLNDLVSNRGSTFIYINNTDGLTEIPSRDTAIWNIFTGMPPMRKEIDELPDGSILIGETLREKAKVDALWSIQKIIFVGDDISITWADGSSDFDKVWDSRTTYTY